MMVVSNFHQGNGCAWVAEGSSVACVRWCLVVRFVGIGIMAISITIKIVICNTKGNEWEIIIIESLSTSTINCIYDIK